MTEQMSDVELAEHYDRTHDLSEFEDGEVITPPETSETRNVTISVRFSPSELAGLEAHAKNAGMKLTAYIRATALAADEPPVDRAEVLDLIAALRSKVASAADPDRLVVEVKRLRK